MSLVAVKGIIHGCNFITRYTIQKKKEYETPSLPLQVERGISNKGGDPLPQALRRAAKKEGKRNPPTTTCGRCERTLTEGHHRD